MKLVVNKCFGGFGLSDKAVEMIMKRKGLDCFKYKQTKFGFKDNTDEFTKIESFNDDDLFRYYQTVYLGEKFVGKFPYDSLWSDYRIERNDVDLIAVIEELGEEAASGRFAELKIVEIPDDVSWEIDDYDGVETLHEVHRVWS